MVTVDELAALVPPPMVPFDADGDWAQVEQILGLRLPSDYRALVARYGYGAFNDHLELFTPFGPNAQLLRAARELPQEDADYYADDPDEHPYPFYPSPGGLLIWAATVFGDRICWLTDGQPDTWPIVTWEVRGVTYEQHPVSTIAFVYDWLADHASIDILGEPDPVSPWFAHYRDRVHVALHLTDGLRPYDDRLAILRHHLASTRYQGSFDDAVGRQDSFLALVHDWEVSYDTRYGHQIRVAYPPGDDNLVRTTLTEAVSAMGCHILSTHELHGVSSGWNHTTPT